MRSGQAEGLDMAHSGHPKIQQTRLQASVSEADNPRFR